MTASIQHGAPTQTYVDHREGDPDAPTLLLLHGLGGSGQVWDPLLAAADWEGAIVVPDLRGHGATSWTDSYSFGQMAGDVAGLLEPGTEVVIAGHSMGGVVALALASGWFSVDVKAVMTIGVKVEWSAEELAAIPVIAAKPTRQFAERAEALQWGMKLAGLYGVVDDDHPITERLVRPLGDAWIAALDPRAGTVGQPPLEALHHGLSMPVVHVAGSDDAMTGVDQLSRFGPPITEIAGAGHNTMVEQPEEVWRAFRQILG